MRAVSGTAFSAVTFLLPLTVAFPSSASSSFELSPRYDHSSLGEVAEDVGKTGWATLVAVHAVCGFVAFQVFMPLAVIFAAVGKSAFPDQWFKAHWQAQVFVVSPLAILAMVLGIVAVAVEPSSDAKKAGGMDKHRS